MTRIAEMASSWYQISFPLNENRPLTFDRLRLLVADKQWFLTQVKHKYEFKNGLRIAVSCSNRSCYVGVVRAMIR